MIAGKWVLVTRPKDQASSLCEALERVGAIPVRMAAIQIAPPTDTAALDKAIQSLHKFDWVLFTSANGVRAFAERMSRLQVPASALGERRLAAVGPVTASAVTHAFREPDAVPAEFVSVAIASVLGKVDGLSILLAQAEAASPELPRELESLGASVTCVVAYRSLPLGGEIPNMRPDFITFASSSAVHATVDRLRAAGCEEWLRAVPIVCIGPVTSASVVELGYTVAATAAEHTAEGLVQALVRLTSKESQRV